MYKDIFSNLLTYTDNLQEELLKYASRKVYTPYNVNRPITPEEKGRITPFDTILIQCSAEIELISNIVNTS